MVSDHNVIITDGNEGQNHRTKTQVVVSWNDSVRLVTVEYNMVTCGETGLTSRQHVPGDRVGDGREDPVELSEGSASVVEPARDPAPHTT